MDELGSRSSRTAGCSTSCLDLEECSRYAAALQAKRNPPFKTSVSMTEDTGKVRLRLKKCYPVCKRVFHDGLDFGCTPAINTIVPNAMPINRARKLR